MFGRLWIICGRCWRHYIRFYHWPISMVKGAICSLGEQFCPEKAWCEFKLLVIDRGQQTILEWSNYESQSSVFRLWLATAWSSSPTASPVFRLLRYITDLGKSVIYTCIDTKDYMKIMTKTRFKLAHLYQWSLIARSEITAFGVALWRWMSFRPERIYAGY